MSAQVDLWGGRAQRTSAQAKERGVPAPAIGARRHFVLEGPPDPNRPRGRLPARVGLGQVLEREWLGLGQWGLRVRLDDGFEGATTWHRHMSEFHDVAPADATPDREVTVHTCHAEGCEREVAPKYFACRRHWSMVPKWLQDALWSAYRPGQEEDKRPTPLYLIVQTRCRLEIAYREKRPVWDLEVDLERRIRRGAPFETEGHSRPSIIQAMDRTLGRPHAP